MIALHQLPIPLPAFEAALSLSSENSPTIDKIKAEFENFNATFNRIELPEIDLESVERDNEFLKDEEKYIYDKVRRYSTILRKLHKQILTSIPSVLFLSRSLVLSLFL